MIIPYKVSELHTESCIDNRLSSTRSQDTIIMSFHQHEMMLFGMPRFLDVGAVIPLSAIANKRHCCRYPFARWYTEAIRSCLAGMLSFHLLFLCRLPLQIPAHLQIFFITTNKRVLTSWWLGYYFQPLVVLQQWSGHPLSGLGAISCRVLVSALRHPRGRNPAQCCRCKNDRISGRVGGWQGTAVKALINYWSGLWNCRQVTPSWQFQANRWVFIIFTP